MTRWIVGVIAVAVLAIGAIVALAASGSDSDPGAGETAGPDSDAMAEFRECLTENGAEPPEPPSGGEMPVPPSDGAMPQQIQPSAEFEQAMEACSDLLPDGAEVFTAPGGPPGTAPTAQN